MTEFQKTCPIDRSSICDENCVWYSEKEQDCRLLLSLENIVSKLACFKDHDR